MPMHLSSWVTGPSVFETVPNSAQTVATVIGVAASIEFDWASVLATLTHAEVDTAVAIWSRLRAAQAQAEAILDVAKLKLPQPDVALLEGVMRAQKAHRDRRNRFAHGVWARPFSTPDVLVLLRGKAVTDWNVLLYGFGTKAAAVPLAIDDQDIYGAAEFESALAEASDARELMTMLVGHLHWRSHDTTDDSIAEMARGSRQALAARLGL